MQTAIRRKKKRLAREAYPNRLAELSLKHGLTYADIAQRVKPPVHETTIARLAIGKVIMTQQWMTRLASVFHISPSEILQALPSASLRRIDVILRLEAGTWGHSAMLESHDRYEVMIPDVERLRSSTLYGAEIHGDNMNRRFPAGSVVVMSRLGQSPRDVTEGKRYHVRITRLSDNLVEESIRLLIKGDDGRHYLTHESSRPLFQGWIALEGDPNHHIELIGRVRFAVHSED